MSILLANIGNRNLSLEGKDLAASKDKGFTIRSFTQHIFQNLPAYKNRLSINIISGLLQELQGELSKVVLYGSNQQDPKVSDQDTLYVAAIMKELLDEQFPDINFEVRLLDGISVVDNDRLLAFYRSELVKLLYEHPQNRFVICDAGGTAQQKAALKIIAEFLLPKGQYSVYYQNGKTHQLEIVENVEYQRVITQEQMAVLITRSEYRAALDLLEHIGGDEESLDIFRRFLTFLACRKEMLIHDAKSVVSGKLCQLDSPEDLRSSVFNRYNQQVLYPEPEFELQLSKALNKHFFESQERLEWATHCYDQNRKTEAVLSFQNFVEIFLGLLLEAVLPDFANAASDPGQGKKLITYIEERFPAIITQFENRITNISLPVLICTLKELMKESNARRVLELLTILENTHSYFVFLNGGAYSGLDKLRNKIAHEGEGVNDEKLIQAYPDFGGLLKTVRQHMNMPLTNTYNHLNELLIRKLRETL